VQPIDRCRVVGAPFKRRIEARPAGTEQLGQTIAGKPQIHPDEGSGRFPVETAPSKQLLPVIGLPGAGDPPYDVKLHQSLEETGIDDLEEDEALGMLLQADQNVALDVAKLERGLSNASLPRDSNIGVSRRWRPRNRSASSR